jgi:APA family basic amino acid/polyamine antiporter
VATSSALERRLTLADAVFIGLGSMLGAGVFSVFAPAAAVVGSWLPVAIAVAAVLASLNALSTAQLAMAYPTSGGAYVFGRTMLGPLPGFAAGWGFVAGKTASTAAIALVFATYVAPGHSKLVAVVALVAACCINLVGITRTAGVTRLLVLPVLAVLIVLIAVVSFSGPSASTLSTIDSPSSPFSPTRVLGGASLLFFAFAGYARVATLGEEVAEPRRTIPRAVLTALGIVLALYIALGWLLVRGLSIGGLAVSSAPLTELAEATGHSWLSPALRIAAALATGGALLSLLAGVSRTALAMARNRDLPHWFAHVDSRFHTPARAEVAVTAVACVLVLLLDPVHLIGVSSLAVLLYYLVANLSAAKQILDRRVLPRTLSLVGALGCGVLALSVPRTSLLVGAALVGAGVIGWLMLARPRREQSRR